MKRLKLLFGLLLVATLSVGSVWASEESRSSRVEFRSGVLSNSLTYYLRYNAKPKGQADFYILSDVGAIQEEDDQQGLAHFMEHMAFNGTKNLPDKQLIEYLESIGVKFGANLNAATSWDYTVYMMKDVPVLRAGVIDSAMLILHDWAGFIEPQPEEIDKERGVIKEELRTRDGAGWRATIALIESLARGTKYTERNLIGSLEGLDSFEHDVLTRFYHDWYRPDYQAIIISGDIDVEQVEEDLIARFGDLPAARSDAPQKAVIRVEGNSEPIVRIFTDREQTYSKIDYYIKREAMDRDEASSDIAAMENYVTILFDMMISDRFSELTMQPNSPILGGGAYFGRVGVVPTLATTSYSVQSVEGQMEQALRLMLDQIEKVRRGGFYEGEFERARRDYLRMAEREYNNRNDRTNNSFVQQYISNYRFGAPLRSAAEEWALDQHLVDSVTLEMLNSWVERLYGVEDIVVMLSSPEKEGLDVLSEERVREIIAELREGDITAYEDKLSQEGLLPEGVELEGSKVVSKSRNELYDTEEWILENGIKVVVKSTQLKADEVLMRGVSEGGRSLIEEDERYFAASLLPYLLSSSGVGEFSAVELGRQLAGRSASVGHFVDGYSHGFRGSSSPADLETMLQLLYLNFTSPRYSDEDFEVVKSKLRANIENQMSSPSYVAQKRYVEVVYDNHPRRRLATLGMVDSLRLEDFSAVREELFADGDNFTFTFVGNLDLQTLQPLVESYLGSLPVTPADAKMSYRDDNVRPAKGTLRRDFTTPMAQPKVDVSTLISERSIDFNLRNKVIASYLKGAFDDMLLKSVREELGGTYGVGVGLSVNQKPYEHYSLTISYDTNEEQFEELQSTIFEQLKLLAKEGPTEEQMNKSREYMLKSFPNSKESNGGWMSYILTLESSGLDYIAGYEDVVRSVTPRDVRNMARRILRDRSRIEVILHPER